MDGKQPDAASQSDGCITFTIGEVFPKDDPVAVFIVSTSIALNDLILAHRLLAGGDHEQPGIIGVSDAEFQYYLRLAITQLYELRQSVKFARKEPEVEVFIGDLPQVVQDELANLLDLNTPQDQWINAAVEHIRNQTVHFGGKWGWDEQTWALGNLAQEKGTIELRGDLTAGMRLSFADQIVNQHLGRKFPDHKNNPDAILTDEVVSKYLESLFASTAKGLGAAIQVSTQVIDAYLSTIPPDRLRSDH